MPHHSRQHDRLRSLAGAGSALLIGVALAVATPGTPAGAQSRPLSPRFALSGYLGVEQAGNTLLTCPDGSTAGGEPCAAAQGGGMVGNDGYPMAFVDTDGVAGTFDSSSAQVLAPPGAGIAFAGLYWGGDAGTRNAAGTTGCRSAASANRVTLPPAPGRASQVLVDVGGKGYLGVPADTFDTLPSSLGGATFQGFADLTRLFARYSGRAGPTPIPVTVADVPLAQGPNCSGGWSLLLVYAYPDGPDPTYAPATRSVEILDGLAALTPGTPVTATADGFRTATDGAPLGGELGVVLYDGDRGTGGDQVSMDGAAIGTDVADSTVAGSGYGVALNPVGPRNPAYRNSLGYDSQVLDLPAGSLKPGATSAVTTLSSTDDAVTVGALVLVSRVDPLLGIAQTVTRPDGSQAGYADLVTGDRVRYTLRLRALAAVTAVTVAATPAPGLAPVAGSLTLDGAPVAPAAGDLSATGARLTLSGLAQGAVAVVGYDAVVGAGAAPGVPLASHATVRYSVAGAALVGYAPPVAVLANRVDLGLTQTTDTRTVAAGHPAVLTVTVTNQGKVPASGVAVADPLPAGLALVRADAAQGSYDPASGAWSIGALAAGAAAVLRLTVAPAGVPAPSGSAAPAAAQSSTRPPSAPSSAPTPTAPTPGATSSTTVTDTAEISGADQPDLDSLAGDGLAGEDDIAAVTLTVTAPAGTAPAGTSPDSGVQARTTRPAGLSFDTVLTVAAALVGAALILIGAMVFVSARRR